MKRTQLGFLTKKNPSRSGPHAQQLLSTSEGSKRPKPSSPPILPLQTTVSLKLQQLFLTGKKARLRLHSPTAGEIPMPTSFPPIRPAAVMPHSSQAEAPIWPPYPSNSRSISPRATASCSTTSPTLSLSLAKCPRRSHFLSLILACRPTEISHAEIQQIYHFYEAAGGTIDPSDYMELSFINFIA